MSTFFAAALVGIIMVGVFFSRLPSYHQISIYPMVFTRHFDYNLTRLEDELRPFFKVRINIEMATIHFDFSAAVMREYCKRDDGGMTMLFVDTLPPSAHALCWTRLGQAFT